MSDNLNQILVSNTSVFLQIMKEANKNFVKVENQRRAYEKKRIGKGYDSKLNQFLIEETKSSFVTIVFAAAYLESFIYDYGSLITSPEYFDEHLDGLDAVSKWVVIPELVNGRGIKTDKAAFSCLSELIKCRNRIIHSKSRTADRLVGRERKGQGLIESESKCARTAPQIVKSILKALLAVESNENMKEIIAHGVGCL
jgi:hypothetical protein